MRLKGNRIILGVCGGIAIYKICDLVRKLAKTGFIVNVVMTENAQKFVTEETFRTLSGRHVYTDTFEYTDPSRVEHIALAQEADLMVIAPATANTIAKIANGIADNFLTTTYLAFKGKVLLFPSMNENMYLHPTTQKNLEKLRELGVYVFEPEEGELACKDTGKGRLPDVDFIFEEIVYHLSKDDFEGKKIIVTAGPTREHIDPIRFISNPSSGKMGFAIAKAASRRKADVTLISGPTSLKPPNNVKLVNIISAEQMYDEVMKHFTGSEILIMSAAIADYKPKKMFSSKIKKEIQKLDQIELERTKDIILEASRMKKNGGYIVGFAAETENILENAQAKLKRKNMDMIVANMAKEAFQKDTNKIILIKRNGEIRYFPEMSKEDLADEILDEIAIDYSITTSTQTP